MRLPFHSLTRLPGAFINPILIKEVRQGVRSRVYTALFLCLQLAMMFYLLFDLVAMRNSEDLNADWVFWVLLSGFLIFCLPLVGANALSAEMRGARLDLIQLTSLSSRQIVYGKWLAIVGQGVLLVTSLLPYLVLRYYIGSVEFLQTLLFVLIILAYGAIVTAITVSLSVIRSAILRWTVIAIGSMFFLPTLIGSVYAAINMPGDMLEPVFATLVVGVPAVLLVFEFAAARLNPIEENHDTLKRLLVLLMLALVFALSRYASDDSALAAAGVFTACLALVVWDGICRDFPKSPAQYEPFVRMGTIGRLLGRWLLYPGWAPTLVFGTVTFAIALLLARPLKTTELVNETLPGLLIAVGFFAFPLMVILLTPLGRRRYGAVFFFFQLIIILVTLLQQMMEKASGIESTLLVCWMPTASVCLLLKDYSPPGDGLWQIHALAPMATTVISCIVLGVLALRRSRQVMVLENRARDNIAARRQREATAAQTPLDNSATNSVTQS